MINYDDELLTLRPCDSNRGVTTLGLGMDWLHTCPHCNHHHLREVFSVDARDNHFHRIQCPNCLSRTFDVRLDFDYSSATSQFKRGWFWFVDEEGYPVFGNGKRVTPHLI